MGIAWPEPKPVLEHSRDPIPCNAAVKQTQGAVKEAWGSSPLPSGVGVTGVSGREESGQGRWSRLGWFIPPPRRTSDAQVMRAAGGARPQVDQRESWGNTAQAGDSRLWDSLLQGAESRESRNAWEIARPLCFPPARAAVRSHRKRPFEWEGFTSRPPNVQR